MTTATNEVPVFKFSVFDYTKLTNPSISFLPSKAHSNDTGWDVRAAASCS